MGWVLWGVQGCRVFVGCPWVTGWLFRGVQCHSAVTGCPWAQRDGTVGGINSIRGRQQHSGVSPGPPQNLSPGEPGGHLQRHPPERPPDEPKPARPRRSPRAHRQHRQRGRLRGTGPQNRRRRFLGWWGVATTPQNPLALWVSRRWVKRLIRPPRAASSA